jgi:hypothetical protein
MDLLEAEIAVASGGRKRTLLEAYDLLLDAVTMAVPNLPNQKPSDPEARTWQNQVAAQNENETSPK